MTCRLCGGATEAFGETAVLGRHRATYLRCAACGYVFVEDPHWLAEAYADHAIAALDTGIVMRNLWLADAVDALLRWRFRGVRTALDWGGGTGLFVRLMRDRGHDFRWSDPHCENLFALGFEADEQQPFDLVTCFEVVEHLTDPLPAFERLAPARRSCCSPPSCCRSTTTGPANGITTRRKPASTSGSSPPRACNASRNISGAISPATAGCCTRSPPNRWIRAGCASSRSSAVRAGC